MALLYNPVCHLYCVHFYVFIFFVVVLFYYFYTEMLCDSCGSRQCQTKSKLRNKICKIFTISVPLH